MCTSALYANEINLNSHNIYLRQGFEIKWTYNLPSANNGLVIGSLPLGRTVRIIDFPQLTKNISSQSSKLSNNLKEYTFIIPFELLEAEINKNLMALVIGHIGENWEVFLNGQNLRREIYLNKKGEIYIYRSMRKVVIPLHPKVLKKGKNILSFHIIGNPQSKHTGLFNSNPYVIKNIKDAYSDQSDIVSVILIMLYLFMGIYHLYLFFNRISEFYNLFYGLFCIILFVYLATRLPLVYYFISNTIISGKIEIITLFLLVPVMGLFLEFILYKKVSQFSKGLIGFSSLLIFLSLVFPHPHDEIIFQIWQYTISIPLLYYFVFTIGRAFVENISMKAQESNKKISAIILNSLTSSIPGNLSIGSVVILICVIIDLVDSMYYSQGLIMIRYGFLAFNIGIMMVLSNRFLYIHSRIEILNKDLNKKIEDLNKAHETISLSEEKYRILIEGTNDIIFILNDELEFIDINSAAQKILRIYPQQLIGQSIYDILSADPENRQVSKQFIEDKFHQLRKNIDPVHFTTTFITGLGEEPRDMHVRLEYIDITGKFQILGKATSVIEDSLLKYFISEEQHFAIGNYLITVEEISHRITRNLKNYMSKKDIGLLRVAIREMVINAIEHGNLEVGFDEKTEAMMMGNYIKFITSRQHDPRFIQRKVNIWYSVSPDRVTYRIKDEGQGFDHKRIMSRDPELFNEDFLSHGRGLLMAMEIFDSIEYNEKGNDARMIKYFEK